MTDTDKRDPHAEGEAANEAAESTSEAAAKAHTEALRKRSPFFRLQAAQQARAAAAK